MRKLLFLLAAILLISSCKEDEIDEIIVFSGITQRDEFGVIMSVDSTDWQLFDNWKAKEEALFKDGKMNFCDTTGQHYSVIAYPNPCSDMVIFDFVQPGDSRISLRLVDKDFNVLFSRDTTTSNSIFINPAFFNLPGDTIRVYYKFYGQDCELKGHGDIAINL